MTKSDFAAKKEPRQERAKATVNAILTASTYILSSDGWDGFTTNRVAKRAGVNIASLYQYFPNKESIIEALRRGHIEESLAAVVAASADVHDPIAAMTRALIAAHQVSPELHRVLTEELPRPMRDGAECFNDPMMIALAKRLVAHLEEPELSLFVARSAIHGVIHQAACHQPEMLNSSRFEAEVVHLAKAVLRWPQSRSPR